MMFKTVRPFELDTLDPGKLCAILSTHLPPILLSNQGDSANQPNVALNFSLYSSLLSRIKRLYPSVSNEFESTQIDFKLCEIFTAQVLYSTSTFASNEYCQFYAQILDMFSNGKVKLDLEYYFRLVHDMKWDYFAAYLINQKATTEFVSLANVAQSSLSTLLILKRCLFVYEKINDDTSRLMDVSHTLNSQIACLSSESKENQLYVHSQDSLNELFYNIDLIISQLYINENRQEIVDFINANKKSYCDLTQQAAALIDEQRNTTVGDLPGAFLLWNALLHHLDLSYDCGLLKLCQLKHLPSPVPDKYSFVRKLLYIYERKQSSIFSKTTKSTETVFYTFLIKLIYSLLINNLEHYFDCPLFNSISPILEKYEKIKFDEIDSCLRLDKFWCILLESSTSGSDDFFNAFQIVSQLKPNEQSVELANRQQQLLTFTLIILLRNRLTKVDYFEKIFQKRVHLFGIEKIPLIADVFGRNLIKEAAFSKVKIDFQNVKIQKLTLDILLSAFISPLDTYDSLLNSALIFSPLNYNHFIVYLFCHHLRPLSQYASFVDDTITKGGKLNLIASMTVLKFHQNFDILSVDSFNDYLQLLVKLSGLHFETLFANLLAYSNVQQANVPIHWLQSISDLVKQSQFKSSNANNFTLISALLLKLLFVVWKDQTKKEIVIATIRLYTRQNDTKLSASEANRLDHLLLGEQSSLCKIEYLLFYLEESFDFPIEQLLRWQTVSSILYYAAISIKSDWLLDRLTSHSNYLFDQLYSELGDMVLCLTQKELNNLVAFLSRMYSKMHLFLVVSLTLAYKLDTAEKIDTSVLVYFSRSLFAMLEQIPAQLKIESENKTQLFNELLYIFFVWSSIEAKLETQKGTSVFGAEINLEMNKVVQSLEREVKQCATKWNIDPSNDYIERIYMQFQEQLSQAGCFDEKSTFSWKITPLRVKTIALSVGK